MEFSPLRGLKLWASGGFKRAVARTIPEIKKRDSGRPRSKLNPDCRNLVFCIYAKSPMRSLSILNQFRGSGRITANAEVWKSNRRCFAALSMTAHFGLIGAGSRLLGSCSFIACPAAFEAMPGMAGSHGERAAFFLADRVGTMQKGWIHQCDESTLSLLLETYAPDEGVPLGLCQPPSAAMSASACFGPHVPRL